MEPAENKRPSKRIIISVIAVLLILSGITIVAFPYLQGVYHEVFKAPRAVEEIVPEVSNGEPDETSTAGNDASTYLGQGSLPPDSTAVLEIPSLGLKLDVLYGVSDEVLKQGIGFYPQSNHPSTGNVCIAGHRNTHGSPFWHLDKLMPGDSIILYMGDTVYNYQVSLNYITHDKDWSVIESTDKPVITLTTCDPKIRPADGKYNRLIIRGELK